VKIVQLLPGSGDKFYCENCVRDNALVRALLAEGHEVVVAPLYLPQFVEGVQAVSAAPVFFGGINVYLQQRFAFFRKTPRWVDRLFDARPLLRWAARSAGSVRASGLGEMTCSMLRGTEGNQAKELGRLIRYLESLGRPDIVHLSTPLLLGIGAEAKRRLGVPVVCSLQDEDHWIDCLEPPYPDQCWELLAERARDVDAFIAVSRAYGDVMSARLKIPAGRLHVVPVGTDPGPPPSGVFADPPAVGYLARMSESQGLGILAEAFLRLKKGGGFETLRLHVSGGATADDGPFLDRLRKRFAAEGVGKDVQFFEAFDPASRRAFFGSLSALSVPAPRGAAFGTFLLEALAAGVPVVQPKLGAFPEIVEATRGGVLFSPNDAETLARALGGLLADGPRRAELGRIGRESVVRNYGLEKMAGGMIDVYQAAVSGRKAPAENPA
jgi:glycosyltransferase involved in cell wall biosynthesis